MLTAVCRVGELQGGQKVRVLLAQALFGHPQALLLDEPTNNLDLDSIHWLQGFLNVYDGVVIAISHDRHFLNSICTHIADIDYETIITYTGSYDEMVLAIPVALLVRIGLADGFSEYELPALGCVALLLMSFPWVGAPVGLGATLIVAMLIVRRAGGPRTTMMSNMSTL